jgi:hypothetical protein
MGRPGLKPGPIALAFAGDERRWPRCGSEMTQLTDTGSRPGRLAEGHCRISNQTTYAQAAKKPYATALPQAGRAEARVDSRREATEGVDDGEHADPPAGGELIVDEGRRPLKFSTKAFCMARMQEAAVARRVCARFVWVNRRDGRKAIYGLSLTWTRYHVRARPAKVLLSRAFANFVEASPNVHRRIIFRAGSGQPFEGLSGSARPLVSWTDRRTCWSWSCNCRTSCQPNRRPGPWSPAVPSTMHRRPPGLSSSTPR